MLIELIFNILIKFEFLFITQIYNVLKYQFKNLIIYIMSTELQRFTNESVLEVLSQTPDKSVELSGFCHNIRVNKKMIFIVLRKRTETIQLIVFDNENPTVFEQIKDLFDEATIHVFGTIVPAKVKTCTVTNYEIKIKNVNVLNPSRVIPFSLDDAQETFQRDSKAIEEENVSETKDDTAQADRCKVGRQIRLDNRWLDLRIPVNQQIFRLKSSMEACVREVLIQEDFTEIHTPKIIPAVSEGGSNVFDVNYFGKKVYLAQSPQLYKQMMINAGFQRVFEVGPVFRAENANTYRHVCEFTGLDFEFEIPSNGSHIDVISTIWSILYRGFKLFESRYQKQIEYVLNITKTPALIFPEEPVMIDFVAGCKLLKEGGFEQSEHEDIGSVNEKHLGEIIKKLHNTDMYCLINYPNQARPFYTMWENEFYSRSFDIMMRCNEISSGAQRVHDPVQLKNAILDRGIKLDGKSGLEDYLKSFETGSVPHGGCGIGIERLCMLYFGLPNVRNTSLFPRDPKRITP